MKAEDAPLKLRKEIFKSGKEGEGQDEERVFLEGGHLSKRHLISI